MDYFDKENNFDKPIEDFLPYPGILSEDAEKRAQQLQFAEEFHRLARWRHLVNKEGQQQEDSNERENEEEQNNCGRSKKKTNKKGSEDKKSKRENKSKKRKSISKQRYVIVFD